MIHDNYPPGTGMFDLDALWNQSAPTYAPDGEPWDAHEHSFDVLWERIEAKFDFDESGYPLPQLVPVVIDRAEAEREAARLGRVLPPGTLIVMLMAAELVNDGKCYPDNIDDEWWPDGIPADACLRFPSDTDKTNAVDWDRMGKQNDH